MNFKQFFFNVISALPMSLLIKEKIFIPTFDWGCFFSFAFCFLPSKHLAFRIIRFFFPPLSVYKSRKVGWSSDLEGYYIKIEWRYWLPGRNANRTVWWTAFDRMMEGGLVAYLAALLIGLYEYLMKSRWNSIRAFTCWILGKKSRVLLDFPIPCIQ